MNFKNTYNLPLVLNDFPDFKKTETDRKPWF